MWRLLLVSCTLLSAVQQIAGVQYCPTSEFKIWKGYCYSFTSNTATNWNTARSKCQEKSTVKIKVDLASILSAEENKFVYDTMFTEHTYYDFWIGFMKNSSDDIYEFFWVDGANGTYKNWAPGEPNNAGGIEDCTEINRYRTGQWNDMPCTTTAQAYVCKGQAYSGWERRGNWEYFINTGNESRNWYKAREWCNENGGELASIASDEETNYIHELIELMEFRNNLYIGLNRLQGNQNSWTWSDGTSYGGYTNWGFGWPTDDTIFRHQCGIIQSDDTTAKWRNSHCDNINYGFVCKRVPGDTGLKTTPAPVTGSGFCPRGHIDAGDKCFRLHPRTQVNGHTWSEAVNYCRTGDHYRPDIATISSPLEQAVIKSALQNSSLPMWLGLYRREAGSAEWLWSDNAQFGEFTSWGDSEPQNSHTCASVQPNAIPLGSWQTQDCLTKQGFICQTFKDPNSWISTPPVTTPNSCKRGYRPYWKGCYKLYNDMTDWDSAYSRCMSDGADLVSIHHGAENGYIQSLTNKNTNKDLWIGLRDRGRTGEYKWSDGWPVLYTLWGDDEPSQDPNNGGCVQLRPGDGTWEDTVCSTKQGFVCKTTDVPKPTGSSSSSAPSNPPTPPNSTVSSNPPTPPNSSTPSNPPTPPNSSTPSNPPTPPNSSTPSNPPTLPNSSTSSNPPTPPNSGAPTTQGQSNNSGLSGGAVAGIVIGTLIGVVLLCGVIFFLYKNIITPVTKAKGAMSSFSNPLYSSVDDTKLVTDRKADESA